MLERGLARRRERPAPTFRAARLHLLAALVLAGLALVLSPTCAKPPHWPPA